MSDDVTVVPAYNNVEVAARIMRKRKIHHVVVTHEKKVVGIISSFDLLKLIEGHRFVAKDAPKPSKRGKKTNKLPTCLCKECYFWRLHLPRS